MTDIFDIANLITAVGVDAVKIKHEPGLPEKSSNEILTELFSTFNADEDIETPVNDSATDADDDGKHDDDNNENNVDKVKKKKKKSKKKHKHNKEKKHKKRSKKNASASDSENEVNNGMKKKKKHKKKLKRKRNSGSSHSSDSDEPKVKIKKGVELSTKNVEVNDNLKTVFDLVQSVVIKKEPGADDKKSNDECKRSDSPDLPPIPKKIDAELDEPIVPRLLEKSDQNLKGKILIKDLKNSVVYNETVKKIETKVKEKIARMEDGELSDSDYSDVNRTPTLSPTPPRDSYDLDRNDESSSARSSRHNKQDLRLVLKQKEKIKKYEGRESSRSRNGNEARDKSSRSRRRRKSRSKDNKRSNSSHSKDRRESTHTGRRSRSRGRESRRARSNDRKHRDRSKDRRFGRSRDRRSRYTDNSYDDRRSRSGDRRDRLSRGRSRSRERKDRIEIDKKKLLEIARKNAITMIKRGALPLAQQDKAIAAIQAGGKSVDELIDFCKSLSKSEALGELSSVSSEEGGSETEKGFHHPFLLKERPSSIVMNIRDAKQIPTKTFQERTTESSTQLRLQFPVSSGQQHRKTESEWVDVTPPPPVKKTEPKKAFVASTTLQPQAFTIIPPVNSTIVVPPVAPVPVAPVVTPQPSITPVIAPSPVVSASQPAPTVFPEPTIENVDVGIIVSQRLAAMRKLRDNPNDMQALNEMYNAQNEMKTWAESKQMPGQFTGSTGVKVLSPAELTSGYQAWARKDQLTSAQPVSGGMGMALLQKMGWRPGEGLGKNKEGTLEPLQLEVKLDKRGLVSDQDAGVKTGKVVGKPVVPTIKTLEGKHPVSLLGEYCSKRKFGAPVYELCFECGPDHKKNFLFKVKVNGIEYKPSVASPNKKQAKAEAAQICLQTLGLLPTT